MTQSHVSPNWRPTCLHLVLLFFCISVQFSTAGGASPIDLTTKKVEHDGVNRIYHIVFPPEFNKEQTAPLVLALHGGGGRARQFSRSKTLTQAAAERGMVLVFPEGFNRHWCDGRQEILANGKTYDDVGFIAKVIERMILEFNIDRERVYATGISNGGFMSIRLAMDLSDRIAAVAPVAAQISQAIKDNSPIHPISIMIINGTADPLVPFNGGHVKLWKRGRSRGQILSTDKTIDLFRRYNGCLSTPQITDLPNKDLNDHSNVQFIRYTGGKQNTEVILVKVIGGGHTWPGGEQYLKPRIVGWVNRDIDASAMILDFFLDQRLN